jgi:hypothetical protein
MMRSNFWMFAVLDAAFGRELAVQMASLARVGLPKWFSVLCEDPDMFRNGLKLAAHC